MIINLSEISNLAFKLAKKQKIRVLCQTPGMDEIAVRLNSDPLHEEIEYAKRTLQDIDDILTSH